MYLFVNRPGKNLENQLFVYNFDFRESWTLNFSFSAWESFIDSELMIAGSLFIYMRKSFQSILGQLDLTKRKYFVKY